MPPSSPPPPHPNNHGESEAPLPLIPRSKTRSAGEQPGSHQSPGTAVLGDRRGQHATCPAQRGGDEVLLPSYTLTHGFGHQP